MLWIVYPIKAVAIGYTIFCIPDFAQKSPFLNNIFLN